MDILPNNTHKKVGCVMDMYMRIVREKNQNQYCSDPHYFDMVYSSSNAALVALTYL